MKKKLFTATAAFMLSATMSFAGSQVDSIIDQLEGMGYSNIQVSYDNNTISVVAQRGLQSRAFSVRRKTGEIFDDETSFSLNPGRKVEDVSASKPANNRDQEDTWTDEDEAELEATDVPADNDQEATWTDEDEAELEATDAPADDDQEATWTDEDEAELEASDAPADDDQEATWTDEDEAEQD